MSLTKDETKRIMEYWNIALKYATGEDTLSVSVDPNIIKTLIDDEQRKVSMSERLKSCPFCKSKCHNNFMFGTEEQYTCSNEDCPVSNILFTLEQWQIRRRSTNKKENHETK